MAEPACPGCRDLSKQVAELTARVAERTRKLEEATRAAKRQAAPFRKGPPKPDPNKPGRKSGAAHGTHGHRPIPPGSVAERHEAPLPEACPHCRGPLIETGTAEQFQTGIPRQPLIRPFTVHVGHCTDCGRRTQGRHPLQTSDALGAAARPIGPDAQATVARLHTQAGLSHGKVAAVFDSSVEPTNWKAEQAIRPAVVNRKVWGGNRTRAGADAQGVLMSVFETCRHHARPVLDFVSANLRAWGNRLLQAPTLLPAR